MTSFATPGPVAATVQVAGAHVRITAGDRTDEVVHSLGLLAGQGADDLVIAEKRHYLRGRDLEGMNAILREGAAEGAYAGAVEALPTELEALRVLLERSRPGDVAAVMSHAERVEIFAWLEAASFSPVDAVRLRELLAT